MHVTCLQFDIAWEDPQASFERVHALMDSAAPPPGGLILLPEMFSTGFSMDVPAVAQGDDKPAEAFLANLARRSGCAVIGGVVNPAPDGRGLNQAVAVGHRGTELARYTKIHPFSFAGETDHYSPGDRPAAFDHADFRIGLSICYDLRFPEQYRKLTADGATLLTVIADWPAARVHHWRALLIARAIENQAYVAAVNRTGSDPNVAYPGASMIIDPKGEILAEGPQKPAAVSADLDAEALRTYRSEFPALDDMREI